MRFAYADPPYLGLAKKFYGDPTYDRVEVHADLIASLNAYDGWAMSLHSPSLRTLLPLCPSDVRVLAWVKPMVCFKPGVNPVYSWEPVIVRGGRKIPANRVGIRDYLSCSMATQRGLRGAKPEKFCAWLFAVLGMQPDDEFVDLFPGTGGVRRAWDAFCRQTAIAL